MLSRDFRNDGGLEDALRAHERNTLSLPHEPLTKQGERKHLTTQSRLPLQPSEAADRTKRSRSSESNTSVSRSWRVPSSWLRRSSVALGWDFTVPEWCRYTDDRREDDSAASVL